MHVSHWQADRAGSSSGSNAWTGASRHSSGWMTPSITGAVLQGAESMVFGRSAASAARAGGQHQHNAQSESRCHHRDGLIVLENKSVAPGTSVRPAVFQ